MYLLDKECVSYTLKSIFRLTFFFSFFLPDKECVSYTLKSIFRLTFFFSLSFCQSSVNTCHLGVNHQLPFITIIMTLNNKDNNKKNHIYTIFNSL